MEETSVSQSAQRPAGRNALGVPIAIVLSAVLIAGAIVYTGSNKTGTPTPVAKDPTAQVTPEAIVAPITAADHIRGNPNAPVAIVEYSDYDCPYCRAFHDTMIKVMAEYGAEGQVMWVYRQLPIVELHPNAPKIAEASECVAELGGNEAFWTFTDKLNASRKIEFAADGRLTNAEPTNVTRLSEFAVASGVDKSTFESCLNSGKHAGTIQAAIEAAGKAGARGTPYSYLIAGKQQGPINGYLPFESLKPMIDNVLGQIGAVVN